MRKPKHSIAAQLNAANIAITNSIASADIKAIMQSKGYDDAEFQYALDLYENASQGVSAKTAKAGDKKISTVAVLKAEKAARAAYQDLAKTARTVFKRDRAKLDVLGLKGAMPRTTDGFITAAYNLFNNVKANAEIADRLAKRGYGPGFLATERAKIKAYDDANTIQEAAKGDAEGDTAEQKKALADLNDWLSEYLGHAKITLKSQPQLLEKIGVKVRNAKTKAQRDAGKKSGGDEN